MGSQEGVQNEAPIVREGVGQGVGALPSQGNRWGREGDRVAGGPFGEHGGGMCPPRFVYRTAADASC